MGEAQQKLRCVSEDAKWEEPEYGIVGNTGNGGGDAEVETSGLEMQNGGGDSDHG
jgi:hypothetical protein